MVHRWTNQIKWTAGTHFPRLITKKCFTDVPRVTLEKTRVDSSGINSYKMLGKYTFSRVLLILSISLRDLNKKIKNPQKKRKGENKTRKKNRKRKQLKCSNSSFNTCIRKRIHPRKHVHDIVCYKKKKKYNIRKIFFRSRRTDLKSERKRKKYPQTNDPPKWAIVRRDEIGTHRTRCFAISTLKRVTFSLHFAEIDLCRWQLTRPLCPPLVCYCPFKQIDHRRSGRALSVHWTIDGKKRKKNDDARAFRSVREQMQEKFSFAFRRIIMWKIAC